MKANAIPLLAIFERKMRLEVPLFQRQYVWTLEDQWEPLWEDISRKFFDFLDGRKDAPVHFLGAMVLDQKQTPTTHVERRQVIDGQQRLTTLQIFLAAFRDFCRAHGCEDIAKECETYTLNRGMMAEPTVEQFKVWPTQLDRQQFTDVISAGSRAALLSKHPLTRKKYARSADPRPPMVEAYLFFYDQLGDFFGVGTGEAASADVPLHQRLEECFQALKNTLQVVAIDLEQGDDAQVIFETLNARGQPLLPADLVRNYIFLRAARGGESQEALYEAYWRRFDDPFWREEVKQGRLLRPRSDLFMQHFLASRQVADIPVKHLFVEYKFWIERKKPFGTVKDELATLARQGDDFRKLMQPAPDAPYSHLMAFLEAFDIRTSYPLLLALMEANLTEADWKSVSRTLESYLLRRAICGNTTKNYNRTFLNLTRDIRTDPSPAVKIEKTLASSAGESVAWPSDHAFREAWLTRSAYGGLNNPKLVYVLNRLNEMYYGPKSERIVIEGPLTVEHIMPQEWIAAWPLSDGSRGLTYAELVAAEDEDARAIATRARHQTIHTFGNLTILTQALNSAQSNSAWATKKPDLLTHSLLPINQQLHDHPSWNEEAISRRGLALFERALKLWPRPT